VREQWWEVVTLALTNQATLLERYGHQWTEEERTLFEQAINLIREKACEEEKQCGGS